MQRKKWRLPEHSFICLYVGRISIEKNLDILSNVSQTGKEVLLVLAGRGPYLNILRGKIPFIHLGEHKHDKLGEIYRLADCFIFPSKTETFGNVILEALSSGLPIICDEKYVNSRVITEEKIGLMYHNHQSLIDSIVRFKSDSLLYNQIKERAIFYSSKFSWERSVIELKSIYSKLLNNN
ncbi:MAG: glycosyltransferase [Candidatus Hodarchaeota archaeon]